MMLAAYNETSMFQQQQRSRRDTLTEETVGSLTETIGSLSSCPIPVVQTRRKPVSAPWNDADDDLDSVVSSLSSACDDEDDEKERCRIIEEFDKPKEPRSIFGAYWKQVDDCGAPGSPGSCSQRRQYRVPTCPGSPRGVAETRSFLSESSLKLLIDDENDDGEASINSYEQILKNMESAGTNSGNRRGGGSCLFDSPYSSRPLGETGRSWGGWWRASLPSFENIGGLSSGLYTRNARSESTLNSRPKTLASCLRQSRYSLHRGGDGTCDAPSGLSPSSSSRPSVSFKQQVDIVKFEIPLESFAADGWSSWFDYRGI